MYNEIAIWLNGSLYVFMATAGRFYGAMAICPLFDDSRVPRLIKMVLSIFLAALLMPALSVKDIANANIYWVISNLLTGMILGFVFSLPLWLIENIGNFIDLQRGEQFGAIVNPTTKNPASSISKLMYQTFIVYFVTMNGIIFFIKGIYASFVSLHVNSSIYSYHFSADIFIKLFAHYFYSLIIFALPIIFAMFILDLALGILSTFIQQINVTVLAMPLKSGLALFLLIFYIEGLNHATLSGYFIQAWLGFLKV